MKIVDGAEQYFSSGRAAKSGCFPRPERPKERA
jgi:hypothetical protein